MMQLLCNGVLLDLLDNSKLQFTHDNPLFAFDNLKCERTTQFKLPRTQKNDAVFSLARIPAYDGTGMRQKFTAQLQSGAVVKDGYIYIGSYNGDTYDAVFVTGELIGLQALRDAGKISEVMTYTDYVTIGGAGVTPATASGNDLRWANVNYAYPSGTIRRPSIWLAKIYRDMCSQLGITAASLPTAAEELWLVSKANGVSEDMEFVCERIDNTQPSATQPTDPYNKLTYNNTYFDSEAVEYGISKINPSSSAYNPNMYFYVVQFKAKTDLRLEFPENWPSTMYVYDLSLVHEDDNGLPFYGDRGFTTGDLFDTSTHIYPYGDVLAGRAIEILAGDVFSFVDSRYYNYFRQEVLGTYYYNAGFFLDETGSADFAGTYTIKVSSMNSPLQDGDICRLQDNLPDVTLIELLKVFAVVSGKVLNYTEANGISFDDLDFSTWGTFDLTGKLTKRGELKRTFADYAQTNLLAYNSDDSVRDPITASYTINNDNIAEEKTLVTIPFSEGDYWDNVPVWIFVDDEVNAEVLGSEGNGAAALWRVSLPTNAGIQQLCNASTQIKVSAHLTLAQYNSITAKTRLLLDGTLYVWTARSWQNGIADFTLAKIP